MIPVNEPALGRRELELVTEAVATGWVSSQGRFVEEFERGWSAYCGRRHGVAMANGTVSLQAALAALDLEPGDEVVMPTFTIVSCALAAVYNGAVPVLVDSEPGTWCLDPSQVAARITPRTRAVMVVHAYGHPADMEALESLCERRGLALVEDAAEAHGAEYRGRRCGSFGTLSCFSFYANKVVTTGEGGMVLTDDGGLAERLRSLRDLCFDRERRFRHERLGFNFRLTSLQAALGVAQLERIDELVERKREIAARYTRVLDGVPGLELPVERPWAKSVYWMYGVVVDASAAGFAAADLASHLERRGIQTRPFFLGLHEQPALGGRVRAEGGFPVAERIARDGLYLPSGLALTDEQVDEVADAVHELAAVRAP